MVVRSRPKRSLRENTADEPAAEKEHTSSVTFKNTIHDEKHRDKKQEKKKEEVVEEEEEKPIASIVIHAAIGLAGASGSRNLVPFIAGLFIARRQTPEELTVPAIHFTLITLSIMCTTEGFRRACNRQPVPLMAPPEERRSSIQRIVNTSWLSLPTAFAMALIVCPIFIVMRQRRHMAAGDEVDAANDKYAYGVLLQATAALIETSLEPAKTVSKAVFRFHINAFCQLCAAIAGVVTSFVIMSFGSIDAAMFGYSRLAVACTAFVITNGDYIWNHDDDFGGSTTAQKLWRRAASLLPRKIVTPSEPDGAFFDTRLLLLARGYSVQTYFRVAAGESLKVVLASVASETDQGVFGLVSGLCFLYGSLVLWPIETASFQAFSLTVGVGADKAEDEQTEGGETVMGRERARKHEAFEYLVNAVRIAIYVALVCACFGPQLADKVIWTLYGETWASTAAPAVLADYYFLLGLMTINSLTETFIHATASSAEIWSNSVASLGAALVSMILSVIFVKQSGAHGIVLAAAIKFMLHIAYAIWYMMRYRVTNGFDGSRADEQPVRLMAALPSPYVFASMLASKMTLWFIVHTPSISSIAYIGITVGALLLVNAGVIVMTDSIFMPSYSPSLMKKKQM